MDERNDPPVVDGTLLAARVKQTRNLVIQGRGSPAIRIRFSYSLI